MPDTLLTCSSSTSPIQEPKKRSPVYSLSWAMTIVKRALESYPREWEILLEVTQLCERQLAYLIACSDPSWAALRDMVHTLSRWRAQQVLAGPDNLKELPITTQMLSALVRTGGKNAPETLRAYLTGKITELTIKEQVKRAEGVGTDTPDILSGPPAESAPSGVQYVFDFR